ncbi:ABC-type xylose transport system permease subunit [Dysgonomonas hofstadii]|uniref:ABC-type xylose transport system permease subunit n=1 Tax=Dysgonomonas hofstadii TaxID=637886 RepID=A0A840CIL0_9BACT|nr:hypothetical protein [Dysgonomonas hofstadii]MBB4035877.1 ABC-type xylose transport system permease subunit [Dysgonomonas hofstadii]
MKYFIGLLLGLVIFAGAALTILALWGVTPIEWQHIWKTGISIVIASLTFIFLWLIYVFFFKRDAYEAKKKKENERN